MATVLPGAGPFIYSATLADASRPPRHWSTLDLDATVKLACAECNGGWMAELEGRVRPVLTQMIRGEAVTISEADRRLIARWVVKTAAVFDRTETPFAVHRMHREGVYRDAVVPATHVYLARYGGERTCWYRGHHLNLSSKSHPKGDGPVNGFSATFTFGQLVAQIISHDLPGRTSMEPGVERLRYMVPILPDPGQETLWPPPRVLRTQDLEAFAGYMAHERADNLLDPTQGNWNS